MDQGRGDVQHCKQEKNIDRLWFVLWFVQRHTPNHWMRQLRKRSRFHFGDHLSTYEHDKWGYQWSLERGEWLQPCQGMTGESIMVGKVSSYPSMHHPLYLHCFISKTLAMLWVSIWTPFFLHPLNIKGYRTSTINMTWNINKLTHLPGRQKLCLLKWLSQRRMGHCFISRSILISKQAVQLFKYKSTKKNKTRRIGLVLYQARG